MARYVQPERRTRSELERAFSISDNIEICQALIDMAYFETDGRWALERAVEFTRRSDVDVVNAAMTAIGHLARLHRGLSFEDASARLRELQKDAHTAIRAKYALEDIARFHTND
jgi:hypothetical protein